MRKQKTTIQFETLEEFERHIKEFQENPPFMYKYVYWPYYGLKTKIENFFNFLKNAFKFRHELADFHPFDSVCALNLLKRGLTLILNEYNKLNENFDYEDSEEHKIALRKMIKTLRRLINSDYIYFDILEKKCGKYRSLPEEKREQFLLKEQSLFYQDIQVFTALFEKYFFKWWL